MVVVVVVVTSATSTGSVTTTAPPAAAAAAIFSSSDAQHQQSGDRGDTNDSDCDTCYARCHTSQCGFIIGIPWRNMNRKPDSAHITVSIFIIEYSAWFNTAPVQRRNLAEHDQ
jgi:hypothetical protein